MKVFNYNEQIVNCDNDIDADKLIALEAEELPIAIFGGYANYANNDNTSFVDGEWVFDEASVLAKIAESNAIRKSTLESQLIKLTQDKAMAIELNLTTKATELQTSIDSVNDELATL